MKPNPTSPFARFTARVLLACAAALFACTSNAAQLISEDFSSGAANFTVVAGGTWSVSSGTYVLTSPASGVGGDGNNNISVHNTNVPGDFTLTVDASTTATTNSFNDFSVLFCYQNSTNHYYVSFNETNDSLTSGIFKEEGGVITQLADITSTIAGGTTYAVTIEKTGSTIKAYRNGVLLATATDSTWSSGKVGFGTLNDGATYDNLIVTDNVVEAPVFSPGGGTYASAQDVAITSSTSGASIRYTTDGSTPTSTTGTVYSAPIAVSTATTLKAIAYKDGMVDSAVTTVNYTFGTEITPATGFYNAPLASAYTGSLTAEFDVVPSLSPIDAAIALSQGDVSGYTGMATIVRFNNVGNIDARNGDAYAAASTIPFSAGVSYHVRMVINVPAHTYSVYVRPSGGAEVTVGSDFAFRTEQASVTVLDRWNAAVGSSPGGSIIVSNFATTAVVDAPVYSPGGGAYASSQSITISSATSDASIRYTTDGSTPSATTGTVYSAPVAIGSTTTLKAIAYKTGMGDSSVTTANYTIGSEITPATGFYNAALDSSYTGSLTAEFDVVPSLSPIDAAIALSQGDVTGYTGMATIVRFNNVGNIDARNGGSYAAASTIPFSAGVSYHVRMVINVPAHTYSVYVRPSGGTEMTVGSDFAFRTEQAGVTALDRWNAAVGTDPGGSIIVSNFAITASVQNSVPQILTTTLPDATIDTAYSQALSVAGGDGTLTWSLASGTLPSGITFSTDGTLSGTPTTSGTFSFTVRVADADEFTGSSDEDTQALSLVVSGSSSSFAGPTTTGHDSSLRPGGPAMLEAPISSFISTGDNTTITGKDVTGQIMIRHANVTVDGNRCYYITVDSNYPNASATISWNTVGPRFGVEPLVYGGIKGRNITAFRNKIRGNVDAFVPRANYVAYENYVCGLYAARNDRFQNHHPTWSAHPDGVQMAESGSTIHILRNRFDLFAFYGYDWTRGHQPRSTDSDWADWDTNAERDAKANANLSNSGQTQRSPRPTSEDAVANGFPADRPTTTGLLFNQNIGPGIMSDILIDGNEFDGDVYWWFQFIKGSASDGPQNVRIVNNGFVERVATKYGRNGLVGADVPSNITWGNNRKLDPETRELGATIPKPYSTMQDP